jgi:hypothetical protein
VTSPLSGVKPCSGLLGRRKKICGLSGWRGASSGVIQRAPLRTLGLKSDRKFHWWSGGFGCDTAEVPGCPLIDTSVGWRIILILETRLARNRIEATQPPRYPACPRLQAFEEFDEAGRMRPSSYYDRVVDFIEELVKFTRTTISRAGVSHASPERFQ